MGQRFKLDQTSNADPLTLLEKISRNGISQDVCINDLGMFLAECFYVLIPFLLPSFFFFLFLILALHFYLTLLSITPLRGVIVEVSGV